MFLQCVVFYCCREMCPFYLAPGLGSVVPLSRGHPVTPAVLRHDKNGHSEYVLRYDYRTE
jgi:hypothetical protein